MPYSGRSVIYTCESTDWTIGKRGLTLIIADTGHGFLSHPRAKIFETFLPPNELSAPGSDWGLAG